MASRTGDSVGGLLNATPGNLTELVIAVAALRAGQYMLVKASVAGAIVTNTLFMLGASFFIGGLICHVQEYSRVTARFQAGLLFLASAFSGARKNRLDLSVGIAMGSASQIALFVAPVLVLLRYIIGPAPMDLQFWPGAVAMMLIATITASSVTNSGRSAWFAGVHLLMVYRIFAMTHYLLPPRVP